MEKQIFKFTDYKVDVEIDGHDFKLDCSSKTADKITAASEEFRKISTAMINGEKTVADAIEYGHAFIDELLGEGASKVIFAERDALIDDVTDLFMWISQTVSGFQTTNRSRWR